MKLDISIQNFGKINQANLKIRPFTVIAGPNSSGKSFATKALYSFLSTLNIDHVAEQILARVILLEFLIHNKSNYSGLIQNNLKVKEFYSELLEQLKNLEITVKNTVGKNTFSDQTKAFIFKKAIENFETYFNKLQIPENNNLSDIIVELKNIADNPIDCLLTGIQNGFIDALKENFQVSALTDLKNYHTDNNAVITFNFGILGLINIAEENVTFNFNQQNIDEFQKLHSIVYMELPIYWKMKKALYFVKQQNTIFRNIQKKLLTGVPQHFYNLIELLKKSVKNTENSICLEQNNIENAIGGKINISQTGDLYFKENGSTKEISLHSTALGVTNLGLISLLLKRGVLADGSFLFIDEPEAHLHPAWQKIMIDTLFELSKKGVHIVIASHSIDMMKCIENIMEREQTLDLAEHFGINQLSAEGNSINENYPVLKKIAAIKEDLGQSFYEMFLDSQWN